MTNTVKAEAAQELSNILKDIKMDSCISIRQYGTPIKNSKSLKKINNSKKEVSKSLVFGK